MAPVTVTSTGVARHPIDDSNLKALISRLRLFDNSPSSVNTPLPQDQQEVEIDIEGLIGELERFTEWRYGELTDLYEWTKPLNAMDLALRKLLNQYPNLLLISLKDESKSKSKSDPSQNEIEKEQDDETERTQAESEHEADAVPPSIKHAISTILRFLSSLLRNAYNKSVFNSVQETTSLLAAADDEIASQALGVLSSLAMPVPIHKLGVPDTSQNNTAFSNSKSTATYSRLMMLAKGWGSKGSGLGLATSVITDDSYSGQGLLPEYGGILRYEFLPPSSSKLVRVELSSNDICLHGFSSRCNLNSEVGVLDRQVEKKRKTIPTSFVGGPASRETKSTSYLFFKCLEQVGGRKNISSERMFDLLAHIRLAKSFHSRSARILAVKRRLNALLAVLYVHPSNAILAGYFHAQPELCSELTDLVRPTVSQAAVSSSQLTFSRESNDKGKTIEDRLKMKQAAIESIVVPYASIPYDVRSLAVEVLTALVGRKDDSSSGISQIAKQVNILNELGVGKGQFSGLLPTLIRYSLASSKSFVVDLIESKYDDKAMNVDVEPSKDDEEAIENELGLQLGLEFVNATKPVLSMGQIEAEEMALEFISCVLSLANAVISSTSGTASLTDCGLIPALVSTISLHQQIENASTKNGICERKTLFVSMFEFIIAQSIQLLEGAVTNNSQALAAFHELNGVEMLLKSFHAGIANTSSSNTNLTPQTDLSNQSQNDSRHFHGSERVLLNSTLNCLTVIFHLHETSARSTSPTLTPSAVLRRKEMTDDIIHVMSNISLYCGTLTSLVITFLGDVMNSDPRVVHYVYKSGLADAFFSMIKSKSVVDSSIPPEDSNVWYEPTIPASQELVVAVPNIIAALALTEEGRKKISEIDPFPDILAILCTPRFVMPNSRCMASDVPAMMGSGLDEMMRHVPSLKRKVMNAIVSFIKRVVYIGKGIVIREIESDKTDLQCSGEDRINFMQYSHHVVQILEQILQNDEHCNPFAAAGGVTALLQLHPLLMLSGKQFLTHISTQSSPSVAILSHSTTALSITTAIKRVASNNNGNHILKDVKEFMIGSLEILEESIMELRKLSNTDLIKAPYFDENDALNVSGILDSVPNAPLHTLQGKVQQCPFIALSSFLRNVIHIEWCTQLLSSIIRMSFGIEIGLRGRSKWHEEIISDDFHTLLERMSLLYRSSIFEVCRIRSMDDFDKRNDRRWLAPGNSDNHPAWYKLRIVCAEGAIVRDGIDIDSCASVGSLEMGEEVFAFDRCVNGSGIMRYKTARGWVSEQTRGHGREPISEVFEIGGVAPKRNVPLTENSKTSKAIEIGIPDLNASCASILSRLQNSQCFLYTSLSRATVVGFKSVTNRATSSHDDISKTFASALVRQTSGLLRSNFNLKPVTNSPNAVDLNEGGRALFLGNMLNILHCCIYEERRDKKFLNVLIFCNLLIHDGYGEIFFIPEKEALDSKPTLMQLPNSGFYEAIRFLLKYGIGDMKKLFATLVSQPEVGAWKRQSKIVASTFPVALSLLRRLTSQSLEIDHNVGSFLNKMKGVDFMNFIAGDYGGKGTILENRIFSFRKSAFARHVHCTIGLITEELFSAENLKFAPPHVLYPIISLVKEVFISLDDSCNNDRDDNEERGTSHGMRPPLLTSTSRIRSRTLPPNNLQRNQDAEGTESSDVFIPDPATLQTMVDMGFSRDRASQALQSSRSNILEVALDALTHPPNPVAEGNMARDVSRQNLEDSQSNRREIQGQSDTNNEGKLENKESDANPEVQQKQMSEAEIKKAAERKFDDETIDYVKKCTQNLIDCIITKTSSMIQGPEISTEIFSSNKGMQLDSKRYILIVSSALLDLSNRYPSERSRIFDQVIDCLISNLEKDTKGNCFVSDGKAKIVASVCLVLVIFSRAMPRLRTSILKKNVMSSLLQSLKVLCSKLRHTRDRDQAAWPCWLAPCILLFDVMAEPMSIKDEQITNDTKLPGSRNDWSRVTSEHKRQQVNLIKVSKRISSAIEKSKGSSRRSRTKDTKQNKSSNEDNNDTTLDRTEKNPINEENSELPKDSSMDLNPFAKIPAYAPLISQDMAESFLTISLQFLRLQQNKKENAEVNVFFIPPSVMHAILLALTKILRSQKMSSMFLRMGGTEFLLSIRHNSRFDGHSPLITLALRRMIEDEITLQSIMETEIRSIVSKLEKKKSRGTGPETKVISPRSFVQSVISLICRDPIIFLRAAATSIKLVPSPTSSKSQSIALLPVDERTKHLKTFNENLRLGSQHNISHSGNKLSNTPSNASKRGRQVKGNKQHGKLRSKSPHRSSKKSLKKDKQDRFITITGSPAQHVTSQLLGAFLRDYETKKLNSELFISIIEYLEIIADLVLKVPACMTVVHNYQPTSQISITNALIGSKPPQQNLVNFLLHELLCSPRISPAKEQNIENFSEPDKEKTKDSYLKTKISQNAARVLVVLVAKAGEGRRRVISELSNALRSDCNGEIESTCIQGDKGMWALNSWGELCIGLAAPRRMNPTHDSESSMSFEVVKVMQDCGMAFALMQGIQKINLEHPLAAAVAAALLRPLELFTRPAMIDAIKLMAKKAGKKKMELKVDDAVISDAFNVDNDTSMNPLSGADGVSDVDVEMADDFDDVEDDSILMSDEASEEDSDIDDSSDEESDTEEEDGEVDDDSTSEESNISDEDMEVENDSEINMEEDENMDHLDHIDIEDPNNIEMHVDDADTEDDFLAGNEDNEDETEGNIQIDEMDGDGWTSIEAGFENMFSSRNGTSLAGRPRGNPFMIAETVIGNILRSGGLHNDALAEIEDTLGIRISATRPSDNSRFNRVRAEIGHNSSPDGERSNNANNIQNSEPVGEVVTIHQRNPPDNLFNSLGNNVRVGEINFMDYQFGGQPLGSGGEFFNPSGAMHMEETRDTQNPPPISYEVQLFPSGTAASTQTRTSFVTHNLISGIDLPPQNSLVTYAIENEEDPMRSRRSINSFERNWTEIRLERGGPTTIFERIPENRSRRDLSMNWTSHGQSIASIDNSFGLAFENALASTILNTVAETPQDSSGNESGAEANTEIPQTNNTSASVESTTAHGNNENTLSNDLGIQDDSNSDGENVASSLASTLTLSNTNVDNTNANNEDEMETTNENSNNLSNTGPRSGTNSEIDTEIVDTENNSAVDIRRESYNNGENIIGDDTENGDTNINDDADAEINAEVNDEVDVINENGLENENQSLSLLRCPPGMDEEVFAQLPLEMQQEVIQQHQTTENVAAQLGDSSGLDPEALAALPEEMRQEIIEQERNERRMRSQQDAPADPSNAEDMDNASFIASLAPDLRQEILLTADDSVLNSLPPDIIAEAQLLRERAVASSRNRRDLMAPERQENVRRFRSNPPQENTTSSQARPKKRSKTGKIRVDIDREEITHNPIDSFDHGPLVTSSSIKSLIALMFLLSPVRPQKLLQKLFQNFCVNAKIRQILIKAFVAFLLDELDHAVAIINTISDGVHVMEKRETSLTFPPMHLLGVSPEVDPDIQTSNFNSFYARKHGSSTATSIASNLPISSKCSTVKMSIPLVVTRRIIGTLTFLSKNVLMSAIDILGNFREYPEGTKQTYLDSLLGLLDVQTYSQSSSNLEDLLTLIEIICAPMSSIPVDSDSLIEVPKKDLDAAKDNGKMFIDIPRTNVSTQKLHVLCATLKLESCKDGIFVKVNNISKRLSKVAGNRDCILRELSSVAQSLGVDALHDLKALRIRLNKAVEDHRHLLLSTKQNELTGKDIPSTTVTLSTSSSELKLLRVLQSLHSLCTVSNEDGSSKKSDGASVVQREMVSLLESINLGPVWEELTGCLRVVSILEGVSNDTCDIGEDDPDNEDTNSSKKLQNSVAGLLSRFLPIIEAFFVVNASIVESSEEKNSEASFEDEDGMRLVGGQKLFDFVSLNKVLINALLRSSPSLVDKGLRAMVRIPRCRTFMDFDVKRHWFRTQVRRLRNTANRRYGSLRLSIRRQRVFEDAYHQLRLRNADEMRGRLHITFVNEEGVDAGGLSREFFGILAKEMFNPNYALFTSTEDGCTFQPNPHSSINPDHLSYFQFVGRIVGKAVADGFLLDAHFTRSLYKHMLGLKPTYHDMQAIDPDYYKNLKMILEYNLEDIGLELTFSTESHSFGRSQVIDLIPGGRKIKVTEDTKEKYVSLVCQHRMTTAIKRQINAYLQGFYELVKPELISVFTAKELELLISGLPDIDIHDLKKNTEYQGYKSADKEIGWFWNIMFSLNKSEKAAFLQFTTGSSKVPLNGFAELQGMRGIQKFSIHKVGGGPEGALMSAHTCFNTLDLPVYVSEEVMKEKLLLAIKEGGGAFLFS